MSKRPVILITNDDGINALGIKHLWQSLEEWADIYIVAPDSEQSAVGLSITVRRPLHIEKVEWPNKNANAWSVNGTPADCIKLALSVILPRKPDLIVSGINRGNNAGRNVLYSGTVAGVIEGIMHDIPGIAISTCDYFNPSYTELESHIPLLVRYVLEHPLPEGTFLNVNFPKEMKASFKGFRFTRQGKEYWAEAPEERYHPVEGSAYYWLGYRLARYDEKEDSDIMCLEAGYATAVPIQITDLTHLHHFERHRDGFESYLNSRSCHTQVVAKKAC